MTSLGLRLSWKAGWQHKWGWFAVFSLCSVVKRENRDQVPGGVLPHAVYNLGSHILYIQ